MKPSNSLLQRLLSINAILTLCALLIFCALIYAQEYFSAKQRQLNSLDSLAVIISDRLTGVMAFGDDKLAKKTINSLKTSEDIQAACLYNQQVELLEKFNKSKKILCRQQGFVTTQYLIKQDISVDDKTLGQLILYANPERISHQLLSMLAFLLGIVIVGYLVIGLVAKRFFDKELSAIVRLSDTAKKISTTGTYHLRVTDTENPTQEIAHVISSFNQLLQIVEQHNTELESKISERTAQLSSEKNKVEQISAEKSMFLARLSHDMRTPLTAILGYAELIGCDPQVAKQYDEQLHTIVRNVDFMARLINDLLDISKIESGKNQLEFSVFDLSELIHSTNALFKPLANQKGLNWVLQVSPLAQQLLQGDYLKLQQILNNLLDNAIKNTATGTITLAITQTANTNTSTSVTFCVTDTGHGIHQDDIDIIFDDYVHFHKNKANHSSTGLGLAITHKYVTLMNGTLSVSSQLNRGSTFQTTIPFALPTTRVLKNQQPNSTVVEFLSQQTSILIIDDDIDCRNILKQLLSQYCKKIYTATSVSQAKNVYKKHKSTLILADIELPDGYGYEFSQLLETDVEHSFIAMSAYLDNKRLALLKARSIEHILSKPFSQADVLNTINQLIKFTE